jgi:hypothetical protein
MCCASPCRFEWEVLFPFMIFLGILLTSKGDNAMGIFGWIGLIGLAVGGLGIIDILLML